MSPVSYLVSISNSALVSALSKNHFAMVAGYFRYYLLGAVSRVSIHHGIKKLASSLKDLLIPGDQLVRVN